MRQIKQKASKKEKFRRHEFEEGNDEKLDHFLENATDYEIDIYLKSLKNNTDNTQSLFINKKRNLRTKKEQYRHINSGFKRLEGGEPETEC
jgi:hypothetical protein